MAGLVFDKKNCPTLLERPVRVSHVRRHTVHTRNDAKKAKAFQNSAYSRQQELDQTVEANPTWHLHHQPPRNQNAKDSQDPRLSLSRSPRCLCV